MQEEHNRTTTYVWIPCTQRNIYTVQHYVLLQSHETLF